MKNISLVVNFEGDFVLQLLQINDSLTMDQLAQAAAAHSVGRRVKPRPGILRVRRQDCEDPLPREHTVAATGLQNMETIVVSWQSH
jgi:toluene monooxygenase system protein B